MPHRKSERQQTNSSDKQRDEVDRFEDTVNEIIADPDSDALDSLDNDELKQVARATARLTYFSGPLPPPSTFKQYEDVLPGTADRIITMAENQAKHRQYIEKKQVDTESRDSLLGVLSALVIAIAILVCGTLIALLGNSTVATVAGTVLNLTGIATIIGTFLKGTSNSWKNNQDKKN